MKINGKRVLDCHKVQTKYLKATIGLITRESLRRRRSKPVELKLSKTEDQRLQKIVDAGRRRQSSMSSKELRRKKAAARVMSICQIMAVALKNPKRTVIENGQLKKVESGIGFIYSYDEGERTLKVAAA
jgi:hypothetical protein